MEKEKTSFLRKDDPKYIDLLDEDQPIAGQKFVCLSFLSPEKILKNRELFYFNSFLKQYDFIKSMQKFQEFLSFLSYKYKLEFNDVSKDLEEFVKEESQNLKLSTLEDDYKTFIDNKETELLELFNKENEFQCSTRGLKIRGVFATQEEAELRCKMLRELDSNHDILVGPVGIWVPWEPDAYKTGKVEYLEEELNQLMNEKNKNDSAAKEQFEKRLKESKEKAIRENIEKAKSTGNVLTQTLNDEGELVNVKDIENNPMDVSDLKRELFEGDNIVTDKNSDHGLKDILTNLAKAEIEKNIEENVKLPEPPIDNE